MFWFIMPIRLGSGIKKQKHSPQRRKEYREQLDKTYDMYGAINVAHCTLPC